ncbi:FIST C-terminal domain-containing protein [Aliiroseovarius sp. KMU-50]|uniref:FIST C-terminal domain-containing protein n=1 Tax=Aliiroseovarius salicola TaxID=3009082 RepID=A0ABT4W2E6_9RHOB|nr:FIST N-terminal domain-containing protein [Aliiroseovarius sp. KMU-50]MDA5094672.1 FIST C-terminal domain-containing protein [Aliiroseovarius sp. KMU-50]
MDELHARIVATVSIDVTDETDPGSKLVEALGDTPFACVIVLASPDVDLEAFTANLQGKINAPHILGARTAGEICDEGYSENKIVALGFPQTHFAASARMFEAIDDPDEVARGRDVLALRHAAQAQRQDFENEFAFLLVDGMSRREDAFVLNISTALGSTQLFGGSSGDGLRFESAPVFYNGLIRNNAAIVLIVRSNCRFKVFREDHFEPSDKRLVVTGAIPELRLVTEINAEPAAPEYARIVGIDPNQLSPFIFASHPIVVSVGDQHHVRAIQRVEENGHLRFFASIDEGMVLTVANASSITDHLQSVLEKLSEEHEPELIFACDCILRRLEAEQKQEIINMSAQLKKHRVIGFSTYGEQHNMLHVNQTLTGIAIYPPAYE